MLDVLQWRCFGCPSICLTFEYFALVCLLDCAGTNLTTCRASCLHYSSWLHMAELPRIMSQGQLEPVPGILSHVSCEHCVLQLDDADKSISARSDVAERADWTRSC